FAAERVVPVTSYPRWRSRGVSRLPTTPPAPATKTLCMPVVMVQNLSRDRAGVTVAAGASRQDLDRHDRVNDPGAPTGVDLDRVRPFRPQQRGQAPDRPLG